MRKMFLTLRCLVRTKAIEPAYARQLMKIHVGKNASNGMAAWFSHGWKYDKEVFGNKDVGGDYLASPRRIRHKSMVHLICQTYLPHDRKRKLP